MKRLRIFALMILAGGMVCDLSMAQTGYIDTHMHLKGEDSRKASVGPGQGRRAFPPGKRGPRHPPTGEVSGGQAKDYESAAKNLIAMMDGLGIEKSVVMPPPQSPNQKGGYTYDELLEAIQQYPDRLVLAAGGGELSPLIFGTDPDEVTEEIKDEFNRQAGRIIRDGAKAFGEMAALHYSFNPRHIFKQVPPDHPLFFLLADLAAQYDVPIDLHMEAVLEREPTSQALLEVSPNNPEMTEATIPGFERLLAHNREARIVWTHVGWDNTGHLTTDLVRRLLEEHPNLYCALKFVRKSYEPFGRGNKVLEEPEMTLRVEWVELMREFPDRFMIGADEFVLASNSRSGRSGPPSFEDTWAIVSQLPEDIRDKVGGENARRVYRL